ncbi:MAG: tripartite tricarboxylate transporter TctB family protein [Candidatus Binatia bacterium]
MAGGIERILFSSFVGLVILTALLVAEDWPIRASIVILLLGSIGIVLAVAQVIGDFKTLRRASALPARPTYETPSLEHQGRWGSLEIWAWLWGLFFGVHLIGFLAALPLFVFLYVKIYGGRWMTACLLTAVTWGFLYGVFEQILHVPWPPPLLFSVIGLS